MSESNRGIVQTTEKCFCMVPVHRRAGTRYSVNATGGAHASCQKPCGGACQQILHPGRSRHGRSYQPGDSSAFGLNIRQMDGQNGACMSGICPPLTARPRLLVGTNCAGYLIHHLKANHGHELECVYARCRS